MPAALKGPALWVGLFFAALLLEMQQLRGLFGWAFPGVQPEIFDRASFIQMFWSHFALVAAASSRCSCPLRNQVLLHPRRLARPRGWKKHYRSSMRRDDKRRIGHPYYHSAGCLGFGDDRVYNPAAVRYS